MSTLKTPLEDAIEAISIHEAWNRLDLNGESKQSCQVPWRKDRKASLSIFDDGRMFKDHGTDESGNVVKFVSLAAGVSRSDASRMLIQWHHGISKAVHLQKVAGTRRPRVRKKVHIPTIERGSIQELTDLRRARGLPAFLAMKILNQRGMFGFCNVNGHRCWILTDPTARNAQIRPLYPEIAGWRKKAKSLPGSDSRWPIGAAWIKNISRVFLTEGTPDLLTAATAVWLETDGKGFDQYGFCCMTGASAAISPDALPLFAGKLVRILVHNDEPGRKARDHWAEQLQTITVCTDQWHSDREGEDFNDWASRHWLESEDGLTLPERLVP